MNKRGNILDLIYVIPLVIMITIVLVFMGTRIINSFSDSYSLQSNWDAGTKAAAATNNANTIHSLNTMPIIVVGFGIIGVLFLASYLDVSMGMIFFVLIIALLAMGGTFIYSNVLDSAVPASSFAIERAQLPSTTNLITIFPYIIIGGTILLFVIMYARSRTNA